MTDRANARHRADAPVSTPLTTMTAALATKVPSGTAARGGLVLAVSSGLVAGVGLPAEAATPKTDEPTTASLTLSALSETAVNQTVSAPASAQVRFERTAMTPSLRGGLPAADSTARAAETVASVSRSLARAAYGQQVEAARKVRTRAVLKRQAPRISRSGERTTPTPAPVPVNGSRGAAVVAIASRYLGIPYRYGGTTPAGFDCSGLVQYVYAQLGVHLPRTAQQQYNATRRVSRSQAQPGDLVFFFGGGGVTHMGIYVGNGMMIAAPHTGDVVQKQKIYSANVAYGRVSG